MTPTTAMDTKDSMLYVYTAEKYVPPVMTRPVTTKARRSKKKVFTRTFAVKVNTGDPAMLHMFVVNLMD